MKQKIFFLIVISFCLLEITFTNAQSYPPGVTEELFTTIDNRVKEIIDEDLYVTDVLNVDSSLGFELGSHWPDVGIIEDSNELLKSCYVFLASVANYSAIEDSIGGVIGIFKNNQILWHTDNMIKKNYELLKSGYIWSIKDLNRDGSLEIMTSWISRISYDIWSDGGRSPLMYLWIVSWNGTEGIILNDVDNSGVSTLQISSNGVFRLADVEGDGIWEIQGYAYPLNYEDSLHITEYNGFVLRTFSWNGEFYGKWQNTPQPLEDAFYPKDKLDFYVFSSVSNINDSLEYVYSLTNLSSSFQSIDEMALKIDVAVSNLFTTNECWGILYRPDSSAIVLWTSKYIHCYNFINPGDSKVLFSLKTHQETLPTISNFYSKGWNTDNYNYDDIFINSKQKFSISPAYSPVPFDAVNFVDTLLYYNQRAFELDWIANQTTADKYDSLFTTAKILLQGNHVPWVDSTLHTVLEECNADSSANITSEAYALLRFNTEYLLEHLPAVTPPVLTSITPQVILRYVSGGSPPTGLTVTATGENFSDSSVAYFNGSAKTTTVVSDTVLTFTITGMEMSTLGNFPVWISNYGINSDTVALRVVDNLITMLLFKPTLQCVRNNGGGSYTAYFGYVNDNGVSIYVPIGSKNKFLLNPIDRGQPKLFLPGTHTNVFSVNFNGKNLTWTLDQASVTANSKSTPCP